MNADYSDRQGMCKETRSDEGGLCHKSLLGGAGDEGLERDSSAFHILSSLAFLEVIFVEGFVQQL